MSQRRAPEPESIHLAGRRFEAQVDIVTVAARFFRGIPHPTSLASAAVALYGRPRRARTFGKNGGFADNAGFADDSVIDAGGK
jgi:hypothetical protein